LVGIAGIRDVIRTEAPDAILACKKAGIQVKMVTGEHKATAKAIAIECNIIEDDGPEENANTVMLGSDFYKYIGGLGKPDVKKKGLLPQFE
jgi:P-type Ca2+ transporter type 2C